MSGVGLRQAGAILIAVAGSGDQHVPSATT